MARKWRQPSTRPSTNQSRPRWLYLINRTNNLASAGHRLRRPRRHLRLHLLAQRLTRGRPGKEILDQQSQDDDQAGGQSTATHLFLFRNREPTGRVRSDLVREMTGCHGELTASKSGKHLTEWTVFVYALRHEAYLTVYQKGLRRKENETDTFYKLLWSDLSSDGRETTVKVLDRTTGSVLVQK